MSASVEAPVADMANVSLDKTPVTTKTTDSTTSTPASEANAETNTLTKCKLPFANLASNAVVEATPELTAEEQTKYNTLLNTCKDWKEIPAADGKGGPLTDDEILYLTRECILRTLRADKWNIAEACKRLRSTLSWRREYGVWDISEADSDEENATGKLVLAGYDLQGRPVLYMVPGRQNTQPSPRQIRHLVFMLEHAVDLLPVDQETFTLIIDFKPSKTRSNTAPPLAQGRETLHIMQTHYPARLGAAFSVNIPWIVSGFFKLITPFIDPLTRKKLHFNENIRPYVPPEQLFKEYNGDCDFEYDHATYWPALLQLCKERRAAQRERWIQAGKHMGESENYLKGGTESSVGHPVTVDADIPTKKKLDEQSKTVEIQAPGDEKVEEPAKST